ncbi:flagellar export chaperone FliS [Psychrobium sp. MM17-31]|uniref:flagellar export chaperone FliS n=1 Tax=Psychrobium sp. MM17-31 TaxID=2917758 RepID=UPI001EF42C33|nr:flagellar export chaperone FliS [Psychrobium sp. MM17-31]MCG7530117.1 flagellar export chaperone FliS [Psychrobium sp. MM17-31]
MSRLSINKYKQNSISGSAENPHQLVSAIFRQLLGNVAAAKGAIAQKDIEQRNSLINKATSLIAVLEDSLDFENGGEVSNNLASLYEYCSILLFKANIENDAEKLEEVIQIILPIKSAWDQIPSEERTKVGFSN